MKDDAFCDLMSPLFWGEFEDRQRSAVQAVPGPLPTWNGVCGDDGGRTGPALGWFEVIGGNPGFGKTLLALLCGFEALRHGWRVGFMTFEMSEFQLAARFFSMATGEKIHALERGKAFDGTAFQRVRDGLSRLQDQGGLASYVVNRRRPRDVDDLLDAMRALLLNMDTRVFLIDYLQLIAVGDEDSINRQVTKVTTALRAFAHDENCLVIALSQFNRSTSSDYSQSPAIQGLHGGMVIEAAADQIVLLDHSRYERDERDRHIARSFAIIGKNRHGDRGEIPVLWDYSNLRVREGMPDELNCWPENKIHK